MNMCMQVTSLMEKRGNVVEAGRCYTKSAMHKIKEETRCCKMQAKLTLLELIKGHQNVAGSNTLKTMQKQRRCQHQNVVGSNAIIIFHPLQRTGNFPSNTKAKRISSHRSVGRSSFFWTVLPLSV